MTTYNTNNTSLIAVFFRDMRIFRMVSFPRHKVKQGELTMMCSLDLRNIHLLGKDHLQTERNTYKYNLHCSKISSSSILNSFQFGLTTKLNSNIIQTLLSSRELQCGSICI